VPLIHPARNGNDEKRKWIQTRSHERSLSLPALGDDSNRVLDLTGLPIVVCSPLRICIIELEPGERLVGAPHVGDSVRWRVSPASYGKANTLGTVLVLKPQEPGLDTTLLVPTERRTYYLRIISKPEDFTARVAFGYPEQTEDQWRAFLAQQGQEKQAEDQETPPSPIDQ
jgi:type IV secretion system protein TrbG